MRNRYNILTMTIHCSIAGMSARSVEFPSPRDLPAETWLPMPKEQRDGIAICLSGGGFRAAVFHLGALRRLNELGLLANARTVSASSGGSVTAAVLAAHMTAVGSAWSRSGERLPNWDEGVTEPLKLLVGTNIRERAMVAQLCRVLRLRHGEALTTFFSTAITPLALADGPERPRFSFCSTDITYRRQWLCETGAGRVGDDVAGFAHPPPAGWTVARAVAASCSAPGVFPSIRAVIDRQIFRGGIPHLLGTDPCPVVELADGGAVDNLSVGPVWRNHEFLLVSDAAITLSPSPRRSWAWKFLRYPVALLEQATNARRQWLVSNLVNGALDGAYWSVAGRTTNDEVAPPDPSGRAAGYSRSLIDEVISQIRIDFDALSDPEFAVLENHGYLMTDFAIRQRMERLADPRDFKLAVPHPDWMDEARVRQALVDSGSFRLRGRSRR